MASNKKPPISKSKEPLNSVPPSQNENWVKSITHPIRDVLIASLDKGQFIIAGLILLVGIYLWRLPEKDISSFGENLLSRFEANYLWGWFLFIILAAGWYIHVRYINKIYTRELDRISEEKNKLQEQLFKHVTKI